MLVPGSFYGAGTAAGITRGLNTIVLVIVAHSAPTMNVARLYSAHASSATSCAAVTKCSTDEWGSCSDCSGKISIGLLCHQVLPQCFNMSMTSWTEMLPQQIAAHDGDMDAVQRARLKVQKKTWRTKMVLNDKTRQQKMLLLCFTTTPIEKMQSRLTHSDQLGRCLWDITFQDDLNPFASCKRELAALQRSGMQGRMKPIFDFVSAEDRQPLLQLSGQMLGAFCAQVDWRYKEFECFPMRWAAWQHRAKSEAQQDAVLLEWGALRECCRSKCWDEKVAAWCAGDVDRVRNSAGYKEAVKAFVNGFRMTGMSMERLLAGFRRWLRSGEVSHPDVERLVSTRFLGQFLAEHNKSFGGNARCAFTRDDLQRDGVPLARWNAKEAHKTKPSSGFVLFIKEKEVGRDKGMVREEYLEWLRLKSKEWKDSSGSVRHLYTQQARCNCLKRQVEKCEEEAEALRAVQGRF